MIYPLLTDPKFVRDIALNTGMQPRSIARADVDRIVYDKVWKKEEYNPARALLTK
jgi:hypothetical protein